MRILMYVHTRSGGHWRYVSELARGRSGLGRVATVCATGADPAEGLRTEQVLSAIDERAHGLKRIVDRQRVCGRPAGESARLLDRDARTYGPGVVHFQDLPSLRGRAVVDAAHAYGCKAVITANSVRPHVPGPVRTP
jgi:hypothetical protein